MKKNLFPLLLLAILVSCENKLSDPQKIVDKTIEVSGGSKYQKSVIEFDFRGRHYIAQRDGGKFSYERIFEDTTGTVHDYVTNDGFRREINGDEVVVPDSMATKYTSSTNSVNYFALLPYSLNDPAVNKTFLGETEIEGKKYYNIKVTFSSDGGGEDFEDVFLYWINQETFTMDYLAYSFEESDEVSFRFRVGYNPRVVNGIRVQDYINYKPENNTLKVDQAEELYKAGKLIELSRIETENVVVE
ncbi:MAG: hypothetical protein KDC99_11215 [Cyclobacteriaceae bacterium]|nr:hypothetical protein [Cyclobacteriaceae bacterium]